MPRLDEQRIYIATETQNALGNDRTLSRTQARSFVRCLQSSWNVDQIAWGNRESDTQLREALQLIHAAEIFKDIEGNSTNARQCYRRAGEILEWLSRSNDRLQQYVPTRLLSAAAYQLGGLPAMAKGLLAQSTFETHGELLYSAFLQADFNKVLNVVATFWRENPALTERQSKKELLENGGEFDLQWLITVELVRTLGLIADCLRRGQNDRLKTGLQQLKALDQVILRSANPDTSLLIKMLYQTSLGFKEASIYGPIAVMADIAPNKSERLQRIARTQFHQGKGILWISQKKGISRLLQDSSFAMCTPTGSGKTLIANLALVKELLLEEYDFIAPLALYLVPSRALAGEVEAKLSREMQNEFTITGLYGGTDWGVTDAWLTSEQPTVLIATVEKADALLRNLGAFILPRLKLLIVDEAHQVVPTDTLFIDANFASHSERSLRLEAFVSRLLSQSPDIARVALTAVAGGAAGPVARWVEQNTEARPVGINYRSTRQLIGILRTQSEKSARIQLDLMNGSTLRVQGREKDKEEAVYINLRTPAMPKLPAAMRNSLNRYNQVDVLWTSLHLRAEEKRILISLAQQPERTMGWYVEALNLPSWSDVSHFTLPEEDEDQSLFDEAIAACEDYCGADAYETKLLKYGIATSHGQMPQRLRRLMTALIEKGICPITLATATLTEGVNLPFDLIFLPQLKRSFFDSTEPNVQRQRKTVPISASEFNNLSGRAGRPGAANGMEGITLIPIPIKPATTAQSQIATQKNQIQEMRSEYKALRKELLVNSPTDQEANSPLALLLTTLHDKARSSLGLNTEEFLEWLELATPDEISGDAGQGDNNAASIFADTLDELDGILLSACHELQVLDEEQLTLAELEEALAKIWSKTFSSTAAAQEAWLETAFVKRGRAIRETLYPDTEERTRLYHYGFTPFLGRRFNKAYEPLKLILENATHYGQMSSIDRIDIFKQLGSLLQDDRGFGFQVRDTASDQALLENWQGVLDWWMKLDNSQSPAANQLRGWQRFVSDNLEFRFGVAIGAVVARAWTDGVDDPYTTPSLETWRETTGLPWFGFWARELLRWGTLDPFVAFCLAQGLVKTRVAAEEKRSEFDTWLCEDINEPTPDDFIDPQNFLRWQRAFSEKQPLRDKSFKFSAIVTGTSFEKESYSVLPIRKNMTVHWVDASGYELAQSKLTKRPIGLTRRSDYVLRRSNNSIEVIRSFSGKKSSK